MLRTWMSLAFSALLSTSLLAADYKLEKTDSPAPDKVSAGIRDVLGAGGLKVSSGDAVVAEFWLRKEVPTRSSASGELGVSFGALEQGVLTGVVRLTQEWRDYKNLAIAPGVYTLRYAVEPADGNHMGVSVYRDFFLLIPAAQDTELDVSWTADELYLKSYASTGQPHPGVLSLYPVHEELTEPKLVKNEVGQWTVAIQIGSLKMGLVIEGHGQI